MEEWLNTDQLVASSNLAGVSITAWVRKMAKRPDLGSDVWEFESLPRYKNPCGEIGRHAGFKLQWFRKDHAGSKPVGGTMESKPTRVGAVC